MRIGAFCFLVLAFALTPMITGCKSSGATGSKRLASVIIENRSREEIDTTVRAVFEEDNYLGIRQAPDAFMFEKKGTSMNKVVYGDWSDKPVWIRVKLGIHDLKKGQTLVDCDVYMVQDRGDAVFEEQHKLSWLKRGPYQKLLDQIKERLK